MIILKGLLNPRQLPIPVSAEVEGSAAVERSAAPVERSVKPVAMAVAAMVAPATLPRPKSHGTGTSLTMYLKENTLLIGGEAPGGLFSK